MKKFRVGSIGIGGISRGVHLPGIAESPDLELKAVCDISGDALTYARQKYGVEEKIAGDYDEYLESAALTRIHRPDWDKNVLENDLKMRVTIEEDIGQHLYESWEKELYAECPLFEIKAVNA